MSNRGLLSSGHENRYYALFLCRLRGRIPFLHQPSRDKSLRYTLFLAACAFE